MQIQTSSPTNETARAPVASPSYSTYWIPLDEPRQRWAAFGGQAELVPTLKATAHAFFALCDEARALKHFALAAEQERRGFFAEHAGYWYGQAAHALNEAVHHWSKAAYELDALTASSAPSLQEGLEEYRAMSRAARAQQERLWKLTDEVCDALVAWRRRQEARTQASIAQASGQMDDNRGGRP